MRRTIRDRRNIAIRDRRMPMMDYSRKMDRMSRRRMRDYEEPYQDRPMEFMGYGAISRSRDYGYDDSYDYDYDYKEDLHDWISKLKSKDKYGMTKEQVVQHARSIGASFDDYTEDEFFAAYLMFVSDFGDITNDPTIFVKMAIDFFKDDDVEVRGGEKLCTYLYSIVLGE